MKAFVFKSSNLLIGKFNVNGFDEIENNFLVFSRGNNVQPYDYIECAGSTWTVVQGVGGLGIRKGRLSPEPDGTHKLPPITAETLCQVMQGAGNSGPFVRDQIKTMWAMGNLTANALILPDGHKEWIPIARFLDRENSKDEVKSSSEYGKLSIGVTLIVLGSSLLLYFLVVYDTFVMTEGRFIGRDYFSGEKVVNLSKQQNRTLGVLLGVSIGISGVIFIATSKKTVIK
jgi:hypothetical protein